MDIISSEQMLDAYSSVAMPIMYNHWSFGKTFIQNQQAYKKGQMGLAYEVVINTNPTIAYLMEDNTMTMQTLVMAHAVCGHGSFFKNNYLFREWTDAAGILDYLTFAKDYVAQCEQKYGKREVELVLDACHALQHHGVDKYRRPSRLNKELIRQREKARADYAQETFNDLWRTVPDKADAGDDTPIDDRQYAPGRELPEENLLYFIEKKAPLLEPWQRELVRIVRKIAQYFYPQMQTQLMNEGWATFIHYQIMQELHDQGMITDGSYLEFLQSHTGVVHQPNFDDQRFSGLNVYALGFAMMQDIKRACENPDEEDYKWLPTVAGKPWLPTMKAIIEEYRDESFVLQFLSPKIIRKFRLFALHDYAGASKYQVTRVHDDEDIRALRSLLAKQYSLAYRMPQIEIVGVDWEDTRTLMLRHTVQDGRTLRHGDAKQTLAYLDYLWGFNTEITCCDLDGNEVYIQKRETN
jgi:spore cortex formation protein SpoVR/YcgB (stage V sporulation)